VSVPIDRTRIARVADAGRPPTYGDNAMKTSSIAAALAATLIAATLGAHAGNMRHDNPMVGGAPMLVTRDIVDNAVNSKDHTTLVAAVKAAGLVETLKGPGPFTVFAPTDAAFAKLPAGKLDTLMKPENKDELASVLKYHVLAGRKSVADMGKWDAAKTVNGQAAPIKMLEGKFSIDGAHVTEADIGSSNGVIHGIDKVNLPTAARL